MEGPECCWSSNYTSSRTDESTAVTISNQPHVIIGVGSDGQSSTTTPLLEYVRLDSLPGHERSRMNLQFKNAAGLKIQLLP